MRVSRAQPKFSLPYLLKETSVELYRKGHQITRCTKVHFLCKNKASGLQTIYLVLQVSQQALHQINLQAFLLIQSSLPQRLRINLVCSPTVQTVATVTHTKTVRMGVQARLQGISTIPRASNNQIALHHRVTLPSRYRTTIIKFKSLISCTMNMSSLESQGHQRLQFLWYPIRKNNYKSAKVLIHSEVLVPVRSKKMSIVTVGRILLR